MPQHTLRGLRPVNSMRVTISHIFASAHATWVASFFFISVCRSAIFFASAHATWVASGGICPPVALRISLPQHTLRGLRRQKYIKYFALFCRMCCKLVDSFSVEQRMLTALTIFPDFSAAKATYVAIIDSLGRTIDRFLWCEHSVFFLLTSTSPDAHTGRCLWHLA